MGSVCIAVISFDDKISNYNPSNNNMTAEKSFLSSLGRLPSRREADGVDPEQIPQERMSDTL
jgi:hypothetical protein